MPVLKHTAVLLELCANQKTVTTAKLRKELVRLDNQAQNKLAKQRNKYTEAIAKLNRRAQIAEARLAEEKAKVAKLIEGSATK